tara:strand:- start:302 stop:979 length:678 start_codon:yes stop_codon:yes gene_type:complete
MINIYLDKNKIILSILITLVLAFVLIKIKGEYKEGFIFNIKYLKTSCPQKRKEVVKRKSINLFIPICKDIIIPSRNTPQQKAYINNLAKTLPDPDVEELIPIELLPFKEIINDIAKLSNIKSAYEKDDETHRNLEIIIANTLFDVDKAELLKKAPYIKKFLESQEIQDILKQEEITDMKKEEILKDIKKNEELINKPTIPLTPKEEEEIRTSFAKFSERCGVKII